MFARLAILCICLAPLWGQTEFYEEGPFHYSKSSASDRVAREQAQVPERAGYSNETAWLSAVLAHFEIPEASQVLVFSQTSHQNHLIRPYRPRAIYYNDEMYLGWVPGGKLEIISMDAHLGPMFYLEQDEPQLDEPRFVRDQRCLDCHGGSRTRDLPGMLVRSVYPGQDGRPELAQGSFLTSHASPIHERWGGWYVTGDHGDLCHMGNGLAVKTNGFYEIDMQANANRRTLPALVPAERYPVASSDIVSLLVLEHQITAHNALIQARYRFARVMHMRRTIRASLNEALDTELSGSTLSVARSETQKILDALLFKDEHHFDGHSISGGEAFVSGFRQGAPASESDRSLKDLKLKGRLFRYRCSYMIYSQAFDALPPELGAMVVARLKAVLDGRDESGRYGYLLPLERKRIREILAETKPALGL